jgi:hypothetical protein
MFVILQNITVLSKLENDMLVKVGYVPGMIMRYTEHLKKDEGDGETFIKRQTNLIKEVLRQEVPIDDLYHQVRIRALAIISVGSVIDMDDMGWTATSFSWTCLKSSEAYSLRNVR